MKASISAICLLLVSISIGCKNDPVTCPPATCSEGLSDCDGLCKDLDHDPANCLGCGLPCEQPANGFGYCTPNGCQSGCLAGFADCNAAPGCETSLVDDEQNCGQCGFTCSVGACGGGRCIDHVTMYSTTMSDTANKYDGDLVAAATAAGGAPANGREAADYLCRVTKPMSLTCPVVRAFLSISSTDEIRDMPQNYGVPLGVPIVGTTSSMVDTDFAALLDGSIGQSLQAAAVCPVTPSGELHWSGSNADGSIDTSFNGSACSGFTTNDPAMTLNGTFTESGWSTMTGADWMTRSNPIWCGNDLALLCLCY